MQQLKSGFKRTVNCNKNQLNVEPYTTRKLYLDYLINPSFQGVNRLFVWSFEINADKTTQVRYYLPKVEVKDHNVKIDGRNFFHQPMNDDIKTYENIFKNTAGQGDDYITGYLSDYHFFKKKNLS